MLLKAYAVVKFSCKRKKITVALVRKHACLENVKDHTKLKIKLF